EKLEVKRGAEARNADGIGRERAAGLVGSAVGQLQVAAANGSRAVERQSRCTRETVREIDRMRRLLDDIDRVDLVGSCAFGIAYIQHAAGYRHRDRILEPMNG